MCQQFCYSYKAIPNEKFASEKQRLFLKKFFNAVMKVGFAAHKLISLHGLAFPIYIFQDTLYCKIFKFDEAELFESPYVFNVTLSVHSPHGGYYIKIGCWWHNKNKKIYVYQHTLFNSLLVPSGTVHNKQGATEVLKSSGGLIIEVFCKYAFHELSLSFILKVLST